MNNIFRWFEGRCAELEVEIENAFYYPDSMQYELKNKDDFTLISTELLNKNLYDDEYFSIQFIHKNNTFFIVIFELDDSDYEES